MIATLTKWLARHAAALVDAAATGEGAPAGRFAFVIDDEAKVCAFVAETLAGLGFKTESFHTAKEALACLDQAPPALILLDVALLQSDAIDVVHGLNDRHYGGVVHLMSGGKPSLVQAVERIGARRGLRFGAALSKPVRREAIIELVEGMGPAKGRT